MNNSTSEISFLFFLAQEILLHELSGIDQMQIRSERSTRRNQTEGVKLTKIILNYSDWRAEMTFFAFQITFLSSKLSIILSFL